MKFGYVLSIDKKFIEVSRVGDPRFDLLLKLTGVKPEYLEKKSLFIDEQQLIHEIDLLLDKRIEHYDVPIFENRFKNHEMFEEREYKDQQLILCTSGFDNLIIFSLNLLDSVRKNGPKHYLFFARNHKELRDFINE